MERNGFLSFLLDAWEKKPDRLKDDLVRLPMIDWHVTRQSSSLPLWMEMFVINHSAFDLAQPSGRLAWSSWWQHLSSSSQDAFVHHPQLDSFQDLSLKGRPPSFQQAAVLIDRLPHIGQDVFGIPMLRSKQLFSMPNVDEQDAQEMRQSWSELLRHAAHHQVNNGCPAQWNMTAGAICELLAVHFVRPREHGDNFQEQEWWAANQDVLHPSQMRFGKWGANIGLVGRPEYLFGNMVKEMVHAGLKNEDLSSSHWEALESAFWKSSHHRWLQNTPKTENIFLPSMNGIMDAARTYIQETMSVEQAQEWVARLDRMAISVASGCWPWQDESSTQPRRQIRRM